MSRHRRIERRRTLPVAARTLLAVAIVILGATIVWIGAGKVGPFVDGAVRGFGGLVGRVGGVVSSPNPTAPPSISRAPSVVPPTEAYTNIETTDIIVNLPPDIVGHAGYKVRLWVTLTGKAAAILAETPVGPTAALAVPGVTLASGRNDIQASIVSPGGESERSPVVTWVLDQVKPKITVISPKSNSAVTKASVMIRGQTQARTTVVLRNDANGATASANADKDGLFSATIAVAAGPNGITITATDPAGNANSLILNLRKGSGKLLVALSGTVYRFRAAKLPVKATFTVSVTGPDGRPLEGARALFTVTLYLLPPIVSAEMLTGADGTATFTMQVPGGAKAGPGLANVQVTTPGSGTGTDRQGLTVE